MQKTVLPAEALCKGMAFCGWSVHGSNHHITKTLLVMKLTFVLLTVGFLNVCASGVSQNISFSGKNVSLETVFSALEKQTGYVFIYTNLVINSSKPVTIKAENLPMDKFLIEVFKSQPLQYDIKGQSIFISRKSANVNLEPMPSSISDNLSATFIPIRGLVVDDKGAPVAGATVVVKGTGKGTSAGSDGRFSLVGIPENTLLEVSAIGFNPLTLKVVDNSVVLLGSDGKITENLNNGVNEYIIIRLTRSSSPLDETVIIAYGSTTKRLNTGNVSTIRAEEIAKQPVMNVQQALQGRVPGLEISFTNGNSMAPVKMEIRGRNSLNPGVLSEPLYVLDGVPYNVLNVNKLPTFTTTTESETSYGMSQSGVSNTNGQNILSFINPKDIESIEVLKDADATAIYGSRASNGVILITTKRGKAGPTRFNMSVNQATLFIPKRLDLLSTEEYLAVRKEALNNDGILINPGTAIDLAQWDQNRYTDWQKELYGTGSQTQVSAGVSGGLHQTTYSINASYDTRKELMNNGGRNGNSSLLMSIDHRSIDQKFNIGFKTMLGLTQMHAFDIGGTATLPPNAPAINDENGELNYREWMVGPTSYYPFSGLHTGNKESAHSINTSMNLGYQIIKGLTLSATAGYSFGNNFAQRFHPTTSYPPGNPFVLSQGFYGTTVNKVSSIEPQLTYNTYIGRGSLNVLAGGAYQVNTTRANTEIGMGYPNDNLINSINNAMMAYAIEGYAEHKYVAGFARINYNWANKYIINLNARRDGSSRFGPGKQFGNFGSVGLAWIASEEPLIKKGLPEWVSFLKVRSSYGTTGGNGVGDYQYLTRWSVSSDPDGGSKWLPYGGVPSILIRQPINQQFQWESTRQLELALEMSLLKDRVNLSAAYYNKRSGNQLTNVPTPAYTGFESVVANWDALVQNSGLEFSANSTFIRNNNLTVSGRFIFSLNRNKLIAYPNIDKSPYATRYQVGKPLGAGYYLHYQGVDPATGEQVFEDKNKDGVINYAAVRPGDPESDRYVPIDLTPRYSGGFGFQVAYKQFDIDIFFIYKKQMGTDPFSTLAVGSMNNVILPDEIKNNHWQKIGDVVPYPRYTTFRSNPLTVSDGGYTDASFVKLGNLAISYELPTSITSRLKMSSCRISISSRDLFYISSFKGVNPEVQSLDGVSPIPRLISSSLIVNF